MKFHWCNLEGYASLGLTVTIILLHKLYMYMYVPVHILMWAQYLSWYYKLVKECCGLLLPLLSVLFYIFRTSCECLFPWKSCIYQELAYLNKSLFIFSARRSKSQVDVTLGLHPWQNKTCSSPVVPVCWDLKQRMPCVACLNNHILNLCIGSGLF